MKICIPTIVVLCLLALFSECLAQRNSDVALVMSLEGQATFKNGKEQKRPVELADCLYMGDLIELERGAEMVLIYSAGGTREAIKGQGILEIGETGSIAKDGEVFIHRSDLDYLPNTAVVDLGDQYAATSLRGDSSPKPDAVQLLSLCGTKTRSVAPEFRWRQIDDVDRYRLTLFNENDEQILETLTVAPVFQLKQIVLEGGSSYCWVIAAIGGGKTGAMGTGCFSVLPAQQLKKVKSVENRIQTTFPAGNSEGLIALALLYQKFDLFDETANILRDAIARYPENETLEKWRHMIGCR